MYKTISGQTYGQAYLGIGNGAGGFTFNAIANVPNSFDHVSTWVANGASRCADLLLYNSGSGLGWVGLGTSTGFNFTANAWSAGFTSALILDFNGDGIPDMLLYNKNNANGYLLEGPSYASAGSVFFGSGFDNVVAADLNSDGLSDVVLYRSSDGAAYTGLSTGNISGGIANFNFTNLGWPAGQMLAVDPYPIREVGETEPVCVSDSGGCTAPTGGQLPLLATNVVQSGQGAPPYFMLTAQFTNSSGVSQINGGQILINVDTTTPAAALNGCVTAWYTTPSFNLYMADATAPAVANGTAGSNTGSMYDNACGIVASQSSITATSSGYTVTLAMYFQPGFSGPHSIYLSGLNTAGLVSPWVEMGMISVLPPSSMPAITLVTPQYETILPSATNTQIPAVFLNYNSNTNPVTLSAAPVSDSNGNTITTTFQQSTTSGPTTASVSVPAGTAPGVYNVQVTARDTVTGASTTRTMAVTVAQANYVIYIYSTGDPTYLDTLPGNAVCTGGDSTLGLFSVPDPYLGVGSDWFIWSTGGGASQYPIRCTNAPLFYAQVLTPAPPEIDGVANLGQPFASLCCGTAAVGSSGRLRLVGSWLTAGGSTPRPQIDSDDPNISLSLYGAQDTFAIVSYTVGPNATVGYHTVTLTTDAGSDTGVYYVGDAYPVLTSMPPGTFQVGTLYSQIAINGAHLGTACTPGMISVSGSPGTNFTVTPPCSDTQVVGNLQTGLTPGTATFSAAGVGYGNGFVPIQNTTAPAGLAVQIISAACSGPTILNVNINGQATSTVILGGSGTISVFGCGLSGMDTASLPSGVHVQSGGLFVANDRQVNISYNSDANAAPTSQGTLLLKQSLYPNVQATAPMQTQTAVSITLSNDTVVATNAGNVVCGSNCQVVVGQQLTLTGSPVGSGVWSVQGNVYSQWVPGTLPVPVSYYNDPVQFYWVAGGFFQVMYTAANGVSVTANFLVSQPTVTYSATFQPMQIGTLKSGDLALTAGISAQDVVTPPLGFAANGQSVISWVQVIREYMWGWSRLLKHQNCQPTATMPSLDGGIPYPNGNPAGMVDSPNIDLTQALIAGWTSIDYYNAAFEDFLLWQPVLQTGGTTYPVPIAHNFWTMAGNAKYNGTNWFASLTPTLGSASGIPVNPALLPTWTSVSPTVVYSCQ